MRTWETVSIVGVGLIGGSIGLALRQRGLAKNVIGVGRHLAKLRSAQRLGAVTSVSTDIQQGVKNAEFIVVCTPVDTISDHVKQIARACPAKALITDTGSTKSTIVSSIRGRLPNQVAFVGSHPLAGSEKTGCENAWPELFEGHVAVVTPSRATPASAVRRTVRFWRALGAEVLQMAPHQHDRAIATTSHLPHVMASVLAATTSPEHLSLVATGWRDTTRVAAGDIELWMQILMDNRRHVLKSLDKFERVLSSLRKSMESGDPRGVKRILTTGKRNRDALGN